MTTTHPTETERIHRDLSAAVTAAQIHQPDVFTDEELVELAADVRTATRLTAMSASSGAFVPTFVGNSSAPATDALSAAVFVELRALRQKPRPRPLSMQ